MAKIISSLVDIVKYNELARIQFSLNRLIAHSDANGFVGVANVQDLITIISPYVAIAGAASYAPVTGINLPDLTGKDTAFTFLTKGVYNQPVSGTLNVEDPLVTAAWNGTTKVWTISQIIDLSNLVARKLDASEFDAVFGMNVVDASLFRGRNFIWNYAVNPPKGNFIASPNRSNIGYQPVQPNMRYTLNGVTAFVAFFNAAGDVIGYISTTDDPGLLAAGIVRTAPNYDSSTKTSYFKTPGGAAFITANDGGSPVIDSDANYTTWKNSVKLIRVDPTKAITLSEINSSKVDRTEFQTLFSNTEANIFNKALARPLGSIWNYAAAPPKGAFIVANNRSNIGYQPVQPLTEYVLKGVTAFVAFFNAAGNVIGYNSIADDTGMAAAGIGRGISEYNSSTQTAIFTTPAGTAFITANDGGNPFLDSAQRHTDWLNSVTLTKNQKISTARLPEPEDYLPYPAIDTSKENVVLYSGKRITLANRGGAYLKPLFDLPDGNQQGMGYDRNRLFVGYDAGGGNSRIEVWDFHRKTLSKAITVATGHAAELKYNPNDFKLYVANGGLNETVKVFALNITVDGTSIQRTYNLPTLGDSALLAVEPDAARLWISSALVGGNGDHIFTAVDIATGNIIAGSQFIIPYLGVPNGLAFNDGKLHFAYGVNEVNIAVFDVTTKTLYNKFTMPGVGEPEGLDIVNDGLHPYYVLGIRDKGVHAIYLL